LWKLFIIIVIFVIVAIHEPAKAALVSLLRLVVISRP
jgi:hypothetical protein